jgi:N-acetylglutamate synthase-like GNAT family acetyltransferase
MVMIDPATWAATLVEPTRYGWGDVVAEITSSCVCRAGEGQLLLAPGAVGVLAGAAPVVWVHGSPDATGLSTTLAASPEVDEVYVSAAQDGVAMALQANGWRRSDTVTQMVHAGMSVPELVSGLPAVHALQPGDLADVRDLMRRCSDVEESLLAHSYGDDFFSVAAPVWMFGARDGAGRLVGVMAVRRQGRSAMGFGLNVDVAWRSTGLSTALLATSVRQAMAVGADFVHAQANERSIRRLADCGFTAVGTWLRLVRG